MGREVTANVVGRQGGSFLGTGLYSGIFEGKWDQWPMPSAGDLLNSALFGSVLSVAEGAGERFGTHTGDLANRLHLDPQLAGVNSGGLPAMRDPTTQVSGLNLGDGPTMAGVALGEGDPVCTHPPAHSRQPRRRRLGPLVHDPTVRAADAGDDGSNSNGTSRIDTTPGDPSPVHTVNDAPPPASDRVRSTAVPPDGPTGGSTRAEGATPTHGATGFLHHEHAGRDRARHGQSGGGWAPHDRHPGGSGWRHSYRRRPFPVPDPCGPVHASDVGRHDANRLASYIFRSSARDAAGTGDASRYGNHTSHQHRRAHYHPRDQHHSGDRHHPCDRHLTCDDTAPDRRAASGRRDCPDQRGPAWHCVPRSSSAPRPPRRRSRRSVPRRQPPPATMALPHVLTDRPARADRPAAGTGPLAQTRALGQKGHLRLTNRLLGAGPASRMPGARRVRPPTARTPSRHPRCTWAATSADRRPDRRSWTRRARWPTRSGRSRRAIT